MKSLVEDLYDNNVIFSYYGFIDDSVLKHVLDITSSKLAGNKESDKVVASVREAISECVEHIIRHNFYPEDIRMHYKSLLVVSRQNGQYKIDSINVINSSQKEVIHQQLDFLQTRSREELLQLKSRMGDGKSHSGLVDIVLKQGNCDCTFRELEENHLFNIHYRVDCLN